jgi:prolactin regulatory element-binding protein
MANVSLFSFCYPHTCRIVLVQRSGESKLSEEVRKFNLGEEAPYRMKIHPSRKSAVVSMATGGFKVVRIEMEDGEAIPSLSWPLASIMSAAEKCSFVGVIKCISFSSDGTHLALGTEDGKIHILAWPSLVRKGEIDGTKNRNKGIRNIDFSSAHGDDILCVVDESGVCSLWNMENFECLYELAKPKDLPRLLYFRCISALDEDGIVFYAAGNMKGMGYIVRFRQSSSGDLSVDTISKAGAIPSPVSAIDLSHDGSLIAAVTPDADQCLFSTSTLNKIKHVKGAHLTFATAVAFTVDDSAMVSVSADASATLTSTKAHYSSSVLLRVVVLTLVIVILAIILHAIRHHGSSNPEFILKLANSLPPWAKNAMLSVH